MSRKILTLCLIQKDGQMLLGMKKRGFGMGKWNGFGGKVGGGETIEEAMRRELREESGLTAIMLEKVGVLDFSWKAKPEDILEVNIFKADVSGQPVETEEMVPQWFDIDEIPFESMWADDKYWIPLFLEGKNFKGEFIFDGDNNIVSHTLHEDRNNI